MNAETLSSPAVDPSLALGNQTQSPEVVFRAQTFAEAQQIKVGISESTALNILNNELQVPGNIDEVPVKTYLDKVPARPEEAKLATDPEALADLHLQTRQMIAENLKFAVQPGLSQDKRDYLVKKKAEYIGQLESGTQASTDFFKTLYEGGRVHSNDISFGGISVKQQVNGEMKTRHLMSVGDGGIPEARPNIRIQDQLTGQFIHWSTDAYTKAKLEGGAADKDVTKRIYLNPTPEMSVKVFSTLMLAANEAGMSVHGKMLDRPLELCQSKEAAEKGEAFSVRADGIVLYADDAQADKLLELVAAVVKDAPELFAGRPTPKVPTEIAEGVALGEEPVAEKGTESLTSHRASALEKARNRSLARLGIALNEKVPDTQKQAAYVTFLEEFRAVCEEAHINPDNLAFNVAA